MANRLVERLAHRRTTHRLFLAGYLPAGYPGGVFTDCVSAAFAAGADAMEIALPNPPLPMDGPLIQRAARDGAQHVSGAEDALAQAGRGRTHPAQSIIALVYRDAFDELGLPELLRACRAADADALLLPQHSMKEQVEVAHVTRSAGLEQLIFLHLQEDLEVLATSGLDTPVVYLQSADLQTGGPFDAGKALERLGELREALGRQDAYVLVGFGIRGPEEAAALRRSTADGVIVGTAMVQAAAEGPAAVGGLVESLTIALPRSVGAHG